MKLTLLMPCLLAGLWMGTASADNHGKLGDQQRARIEARCAADPERCEKVKDRLDDAKARCEADPAACEARKEQIRENVKDRVEARRDACAENPEACAERRDAIRDKIKERRQSQ